MRRILYDIEEKIHLKKLMVANQLVKDLKNVTPVRTGELRSGWEVVVEGDEVKVVNETPYVTYVNRRYGNFFDGVVKK